MALTRKVKYRNEQILNQLFDPETNQLTIAVSEHGMPVEKTVTFDGATTDDPGDFDGEGNPTTLFTVTGTVLVKLFARCNTSLAGASATIKVGTALSDASMIASTTASDLDENELWHDATPDASIEASTILIEKIVNQDILQTIGIANVTAGALTYICMWRPLTHGSLVVPAT
jgi:hypothetical protein